ncbi:ATP-dependent DNA helicase PIF1 [Colletotrichum trifolii]|uniref:ATP-dependent DNA helicase n=1 Tax=Colletotrichum trifolii TaxID=5466 RepID=A0A4R8RLK0_COLTR|nr:ATP-dependent DNA helicase PIF1 [Colletotrichum trifolii]
MHIKDAGAVPEWAKEAAKRYMCTHESRFYITPLMTKNRYYVVYALRGPKAEGRKCGIFPDWDGTSGAKQQVLNCCARHTTASSWMAAMDLLVQGLAMEFRDKHLELTVPSIERIPAPTRSIQMPAQKFQLPARGNEISSLPAQILPQSQRPPAAPYVKSEERLGDDMLSMKQQYATHTNFNDELLRVSRVAPVQETTKQNINGNDTLPIVPSEQPAVEPAPEFPLCPEQQHALDLALEGRNLFITGSGGCGKSVLVKALHRALSTQQKTVHLLAPTGQAAINIGGRTAYNYAGWGPTDPGQTDFTLAEKAKGKLVFGRFTMTDVLIIDEISMVENQFFERLSDVIATTRKEPPGLRTSRPFGGIQIIAVGDFCQLPPVKPFQYCPIEISTTGEGKHKISTPCGNMKESAGMHFCPRDKSHGRFRESEKWAFNSPTWKQCNFSYIHLTTVHRQKDLGFIRMLQNIRMGQVNEDDLDILLQNRPVLDGTVLFSHKDMVRKRNEEELYKIKNTARTYSSVDHQVPEYDADDKHRYEKHLNLKVDMPVILLSNIAVDEGLCNGSQGKLIGFETFPEDELKSPNEKNYKNDHFGFQAACERHNQVQRYKTKQKYYPLIKFANGQTRVIMPDCHMWEMEIRIVQNGDQTERVLAAYKSRTQIPLAPGWAMTIHKSQSLSLDRVIVDLSRVWDGRQIYVALSRARSLEGLQVIGHKNRLRQKLPLDAEVTRFMKEVEELSGTAMRA